MSKKYMSCEINSTAQSCEIYSWVLRVTFRVFYKLSEQNRRWCLFYKLLLSLTVFHQLDDVGSGVGHDTDKLRHHRILHVEELEQEEAINSMSVVIDANDLDVGEHISCDDEMVIANSFCEVYIHARLGNYFRNFSLFESFSKGISFLWYIVAYVSRVVCPIVFCSVSGPVVVHPIVCCSVTLPLVVCLAVCCFFLWLYVLLFCHPSSGCQYHCCCSVTLTRVFCPTVCYSFPVLMGFCPSFFQYICNRTLNLENFQYLSRTRSLCCMMSNVFKNWTLS